MSHTTQAGDRKGYIESREEVLRVGGSNRWQPSSQDRWRPPQTFSQNWSRGVSRSEGYCNVLQTLSILTCDY